MKSLVLATDETDAAGDVPKPTIWLLLVRGDHSLNEIKAGKLPGLERGFRFATAAEIEAHFGCKPGYLGPIGTRQPVKMVADRTVAAMSDFVCGANEADFHFTGVNWGRDLPEPDSSPTSATSSPAIRRPTARACSRSSAASRSATCSCSAPYYSQSDERDLPRRERQAAAAADGLLRHRHHAHPRRRDRAEPRRARHHLARRRSRRSRSSICPIGYDRSPAVREAADALHDELLGAGIDVILDDRGERPGAMFADWELIGVPHRVVLSDRGLKDGELEYQGRRDAAATNVPATDALAFLKGKLAA